MVKSGEAEGNDKKTLIHSVKRRRWIFLAAVLLLAMAAAAALSGDVLANGEMAAPRLSSGSPGGLTVAWDTPSPPPTDYRVTWAPAAGEWLSYRDPNESERGNIYPGGGETSITISGLTPGSSYKVKMRARYGPGNSGPWSAESALRVRANPPAAPTGLTLNADHDSVTLSWTAPGDATVAGYRIWRGPDADNLSVLVSDTGSTTTSYTDGTVTAETSYRYAVAALNGDGDVGSQAGASAVTLAAPDEDPQVEGEMAAPSLSSGSPGKLTIAWDTPSPTPNDYRVTWAPDRGEWLSYMDDNETERGNLYPGGSETSLTITGLAPGATYKVMMRARYGPGNSGPWSAESTLRVRANPPTAPTGLSLNADHDSVTLSWTAPQDTDIAGYRIWRGPDADNLNVLVRNTGSTATSYTDGTVTAQTSYRYAVAAINADGDAWTRAGGSIETPAAPVNRRNRVPGPEVGTRNTETRLVSNTGQSRADSSIFNARGAAQRFTTGDNAAGYTLTRVDVARPAYAGDGFTAAIWTVDASGNPNASHANLTASPISLNSGSLTFYAPANTALTANATYTVVVDSIGTAISTYITTTSNNEDSEGASGWSIANHLEQQASDATWSSTGRGPSLKIAIWGDSVNNAPVFAQATVTRSIIEDTGARQNVGAPVGATDADGDTLTYSLGGTDAASFVIVSTSGQILTKSGVTYDYEAQANYSVTVTASDGEGGTAKATVIINIDDVLDPPLVPAAPYVASVYDAADRLRVSRLPVAGIGLPITGYDLRYRQGIRGNWTNGPQNVTGTSTIITGLTQGTYQVQVRATNPAGESGWSAAGSGSPILTPSPPTAGTLISNTGQTASSTLSALSSDHAQAFTTGDDNSGGYKLTGIGIQMGSTDDAVTDVTVTIHERDGRNQPGRLLGRLTRTTALEDNAVNWWTSADGVFVEAATTYFMVLNGVGSSSRNDGSLKNTSSDSEDSGGASGWGIANSSLGKGQNETQWSSVSQSRMMAVKGHAANAAPAYSYTTVRRSIAENSGSSRSVGAAVTATDADTGDTLTYTLGGPDAASFRINLSGGGILTRPGVTYDHEARSSYEVTVTATDPWGASATAEVAVTIMDVDEPPSAPVAPTVDSVSGSATSLSVSWSPPANTGPDITGYDLRYRPGRSGRWTDGPQSVTGTSATITGLTTIALYQVQVRATNDEGDSSWSAAGSGANLSNPACATGDDGSGCPDFPYSDYTFGVLSASQATTGRLHSGDSGDILRMTGLEKGKTYRVMVDFEGTNSVGGSMHVFHSRIFGGSSRNFNLDWDSNFDGNAIVDLHLDAHFEGGTSGFFLWINPDSGLGSKATHVGDYSVTLTDITGIQYLVGNIRGLTNTVTYRLVGRIDLPSPADPIKRQYAQSFTTGSHSAGYQLDRIVAYATMARTGADSDAQPSVAIYGNSSGKPGTKLCDLALPLDYDPGLSLSGVPTGRVMGDNMYAGACANQTLAASTTYWVVFGEQTTTAPYKIYHMIESSYDTEDILGTAGWTMGNDVAVRRSDISNQSWTITTSRPIALGIVGREK